MRNFAIFFIGAVILGIVIGSVAAARLSTSVDEYKTHHESLITTDFADIAE